MKHVLYISVSMCTSSCLLTSPKRQAERMGGSYVPFVTWESKELLVGGCGLHVGHWDKISGCFRAHFI